MVNVDLYEKFVCVLSFFVGHSHMSYFWATGTSSLTWREVIKFEISLFRSLNLIGFSFWNELHKFCRGHDL